MAGLSVQFYGIDQILTAAKNRDCPIWAIFQGGQFLFKFEGDSEDASLALLHEILNNLADSTAIYTIKFYEFEGKPTKIKANTPYDGSFNFRLIDEDERQERIKSFGEVRRIQHSRLDELERKIDLLLQAEDEDESEDEPVSMNEAIIGMIGDPKKLSDFFSAIKEGFEAIKSGKEVLTTTPAPVMGNITRMGQNEIKPGTGQAPGQQNLSQDVEGMERLSIALDKLAQRDLNIIEHLEKLSNMDDFTFSFVINKLDKL